MIFARKLLVHSIEETDLATANTYVTCRNILIRTNATPEFQHKGLTETHNLRVGLTYRVKIRTTLGTAHRQSRQGILKGLLKAQKLKHRRRNSTVETKTTLVRADSRVKLHTIAEVRLYLTLIVNPCYTEGKDTIRLDHALHDLCRLKLGVLIVHLFNRLQYFLNRLQVLCFPRVFRS